MGIGGFFKSIGRGIKNVASKAFRGVKNIAGKAIGFGKRIISKAAPIGRIVKEAADIVSPFVQNVPILGNIVGGIQSASKIGELIGEIGRGDIRGALGTAANIGVSTLAPGMAKRFGGTAEALIEGKDVRKQAVDDLTGGALTSSQAISRRLGK